MRSTENQNTIEVEGLFKSYGRFEAVKGVTFDVKRGEIVGFLGPNGAGKSTVMKILTCYMSATAGSVRVAGHDVYKDPLAVRRKVGYQPENVPLYDEMVVYDYLVFMAKMRGVPRRQRRERIDYVVRTCGLAEVMGKLIGELSKGYRQRVGLAQALVHDPAVLILDEPMSGLDPNQIIEIRDLIKAIGREKTVIFSSHILADIEKLCDRILIIDHGKLVADGTIAELRESVAGKTDDLSLEGVFRALTRSGQKLLTAEARRGLEQAAPTAAKVEPKKVEPKEAEPKVVEPKRAEPKKADAEKADAEKADAEKADDEKAVRAEGNGSDDGGDLDESEVLVNEPSESEGPAAPKGV